MQKLKKKLKLDKVIDLPNIADKMHREDLNRLAEEVITSFEHDKQSRSDWERVTEKALDLVELKTELKHHPWPNASNVKYPLISTSVIQFAARQMPEIIRNGKVAHAQVIGRDDDGMKEMRAKRVAEHMSYQLLHEMDEWEEDMDKLLHMLASVGIVFKKTYYDPVKQRPISELCLYDEIFIHDDVKNIESARRITHKVTMHKNDIIERMRLGIYTDMDSDDLDREALDSQQDDSIHDLLEQHRYIDLDGDGYEEPYIVLVDRDLRKVLRVVARYDEDGIEYNDKNKVLRIVPVQHFTDFHFIRSPRGKFYSIGFGQLLFSLNNSVNTILNQLIDAGTLANTQSGFMDKRLKIPGGDFDMVPGQLQKVNLSAIDDLGKHVHMLEFKEPSNVLFQLLNTLVQATKEVSSVSDALTGNEEAQNVPATTMLALIEQSSKVFSAIQKRLYSGLEKEFSKLFRLNRIFLDPEHYYRVLDNEAVVFQSDYDEADLDIKPVADPSISSDAHRIARTQALMGVAGQPGIDNREVMKRYLEDIGTPSIEKVLPPPDPNAPPPLEVIKMQSEIDERGKKLELKGKEIELRQLAQRVDMAKVEAEIEELKARAIKALADAEAAEVGQQLDQYKLFMEGMSNKLDAIAAARDPETRITNNDAAAVAGEIPDGDDRFSPQVAKGPSNTGPSS